MGGTAIHGEVFSAQVLEGPTLSVSSRLKRAYGAVFTGAFLRMLQQDFDLSPAEAEIAVLITKGVPARRIAAARGITIGTVKVHRRIIRAKLHVHCVEQIVCKALLNRIGEMLCDEKIEGGGPSPVG